MAKLQHSRSGQVVTVSDRTAERLGPEWAPVEKPKPVKEAPKASPKPVKSDD